MKYPLAERFKAPQGEGLHTGTPMAFVRLVGCSVGQKVCTACDTDYDRVSERLGGGLFTAEEIVQWAEPYRHLCITGGEPLDRDLRELMQAAMQAGMDVHVETSGTVFPAWLQATLCDQLWITVSPKPGYLPDMVEQVADEVKVIVGGLGDGPGWPDIKDAARWADAGRLVYIQQRNSKLDIDMPALRDALDLIASHPQLRLSCQLHKFWRTR